MQNAPSQSLLTLVGAILGDKQNEEVPSLFEFMLRKVMEEFERCLLNQSQQMKKLKNALREVLAREDKIISRENILEALAAGSGEEIKLLTGQRFGGKLAMFAFFLSASVTYFIIWQEN